MSQGGGGRTHVSRRGRKDPCLKEGEEGPMSQGGGGRTHVSRRGRGAVSHCIVYLEPLGTSCYRSLGSGALRG